MKMRFVLTSDWPATQHLIPNGTVIDGNDPQWSTLPVIPLTIRCLDQESADALFAAYGIEHIHLMHLGGFKPKGS
jgi:hypothetical protein